MRESKMMNNHKEMNKPLSVILFIVTLPFVIAGLLIFGLFYVITTVIPSPIELIIYKNSQYYKDLGEKYTMGITNNFGYKSYKYVKKNPHLTFVRQKEGYYYYKTEDSVIVVPYYVNYFCEDNQWYITEDEGKTKEKVENARAVFQRLIEEDLTPYKLKLLVKESFFRKDQLPLAKSTPTFVFYKSHKDMEQVARQD